MAPVWFTEPGLTLKFSSHHIWYKEDSQTLASSSERGVTGLHKIGVAWGMEKKKIGGAFGRRETGYSGCPPSCPDVGLSADGGGHPGSVMPLVSSGL